MLEVSAVRTISTSHLSQPATESRLSRASDPSVASAWAWGVMEATEEATEEATVEEGTREAITARGRRRPSQAMVAMEEDILEAMEEAMEVVMVVMAVAMEAIAEDTPEEAMVTMAKERPSLDTGHTALMDLMEAAAMVAIALATAPDMDLMEVGMAGTPEVADRMAEVTATGDNFSALI